ncbi:MAG: AI-2E family transporter [Candidatus Delongbacteria bacterium]
MDQRITGYVRLAGIALLVLGALAVLRIFLPAILLAGVVCLATWPLFLRLRRLLGGRVSLAALIMVLGMIALVVGPTALLAVNLAGKVSAGVDTVRTLLGQGPLTPPAWLGRLPVVGGQLVAYWQALASGGDEAVALLKSLLEPARALLLGTAAALGRSLLQMIFAAFIGFFLYRDGEQLHQHLRSLATRLAGGLGDELLDTVHGTVSSVVHGLFGAALAQAFVAFVGFLIAGVPGAPLLASATFFLSLIPVGPPLLWGGASFWLLSQGAYGRAIFLILWGLLVISSIDNLVRPYLISRGSRLSILMIVLGVVGGIAAFGFIGIFIGPPILAVGLALLRQWTDQQAV